jgi:N-acetylmuramoyl-L-alanine amidase
MKLSKRFWRYPFPTGVSIHRRKQEWSGRSLEVLVRNGKLKSPEYWLGNAQAGKTVSEYAG